MNPLKYVFCLHLLGVIPVCSDTITSNVSVLSEEFFIPQLIRTRRVWIYLPQKYYKTKEKYPVIYMQDGQNLFDEGTSAFGEWKIDESLNQLEDEGQRTAIVIGIDHGGDHRIDEYSPWVNPQVGGGEGDLYIKFIVETLKPYIDRHFRTLTDSTHTAIVGSSMGGLIAFYGGLKYSNVFGRIGVFSPSFPLFQESFQFAQKVRPHSGTRLFFLAGSKEIEIAHSVLEMEALLKSSLGNPSEIATQIVPGSGHNESLWAQAFPGMFQWLFSPSI